MGAGTLAAQLAGVKGLHSYYSLQVGAEPESVRLPRRDGLQPLACFPWGEKPP